MACPVPCARVAKVLNPSTMSPVVWTAATAGAAYRPPVNLGGDLDVRPGRYRILPKSLDGMHSGLRLFSIKKKAVF